MLCRRLNVLYASPNLSVATVQMHSCRSSNMCASRSLLSAKKKTTLRIPANVMTICLQTMHRTTFEQFEATVGHSIIYNGCHSFDQKLETRKEGEAYQHVQHVLEKSHTKFTQSAPPAEQAHSRWQNRSVWED